MVDEKKLAELVAAKSGINIEEVEKQLDELTKGIQAAGKDNPFKIEGFGAFKKKRNRTQFEPDEVLATEINQKYTGMKPIELMGSFKETGANKPAEPLEDVEKYKRSEPKREPEQAEVEPKVTKAKAKQKKREKDEVTEKVERTKKVKEPRSTNETGVGSIILIILAIIIAILLAGWLLYNMGVFSAGDGAGNAVTGSTVITNNNYELRASLQTPDINVTSINKRLNEVMFKTV